tara:strand:- start:2587 stop:2817 length:231 start_codon:yes stop_codon:yes gene_type:complete
MDTLTKEELSFLQDSIKNLNSAKSLLADLEIKKHETLLMIDKYKNMVQIKENELIDKYGLNSVINIETGQVKKKEE